MIIDGMLTYTAGNENKIVEIKEMDIYLQEMTQVQKRNLLATGAIPPRRAGHARTDEHALNL